MELKDLRFFQKGQRLQLCLANGALREWTVQELNPLAKQLTGIEPVSNTQIKLYFDDQTEAVLMDVAAWEGVER